MDSGVWFNRPIDLSYPQYLVCFNYVHNIREPHNSSVTFNEWLAGVVDGDGYFYIREGKPPVFKINMESKNAPLLLYIQSIIGGRFYEARAAYPNVVSYHITNKKSMVDLIIRINGNIRISIRVPQFIKVCEYYNIPYIPAVPLTTDNAWYSGFIDTDGSVVAQLLSSKVSVIISASNKIRDNLLYFPEHFNGNIYASGTKSPAFIWKVSRKDDVLNMVQYLRKCPLYSHKQHRINMIDELYHLHSINAHKSSSSHNSAWVRFVTHWKILY